MRSSIFLFALLGVLGHNNQALALIKPQVGVGYSDNVNLESSQKDADFYWWGRVLALHSSESWDTTLWLNVKDYRTQNSSDQTHARIGFTYLFDAEDDNELTADISFGRVQYRQGTTNSTGVAYSNTYVVLSTGSEFPTDSGSIEWQLALQNSAYEDLNHRSDQEARGNVTLSDFTTELGYAHSTDVYYSRAFLDLSYNLEDKDKSHWCTILGISLRYSYFPDRKFSQTVQSINNNTGQIQTSVQQENESQLLLQFQPGLSKIYGATKIRMGFNLSYQKSRSQNADYLEQSLVASIERPF